MYCTKPTGRCKLKSVLFKNVNDMYFMLTTGWLLFLVVTLEDTGLIPAQNKCFTGFTDFCRSLGVVMCLC